MSNALAIYQGVQGDLVPFLEMMRLPTATYVGCPPDQAPAVLLTCMCDGITLMDYNRTYHTILGKPSMKADAMLALFRTKHGGKHRIIERSATRAALELEADGEKCEFSFTWEEAQNSRWPWDNWKSDKRVLKDNWATPDDQKKMLWARCVSDALRAFCPEVVAGIYTPEELEDAGVVAPNAPAAPAEPKKSALDIAREAATSATVVTAQVVSSPGSQSAAAAESDTLPADAEVEIDDAEVEYSSETVAKENDERAQQPVTERQMKLILHLWQTLEVPEDAQQKQLAKRGVDVLAKLTRGTAHDLIDRLNAVAVERGHKTVHDDDNPTIPF